MTDYVLMKRGLYYRPNDMGYTGVLAEAGRYTEEQARARVEHTVEVTMLPAHDAYPFSPACWPETQIEILRRERDALRARVAELEADQTTMQERLWEARGDRT